jgi:F0F1-type ATP synthase delta subunit
MERMYAQALWEMAEKGMEPKKAVSALYEHLKLRGREALMPRIAKAFERLAARDDGKNTVTLTVAHEKDAHKAKSHIRDMLKKFQVAEADVAIRLDGSLIGGWRLEGKESLVDASFKKSLLEMYNRATA